MKSTAAKQIVTAAGTLVFCLAACGLAFVLASAYWGVGKDWELLDLYRFLIQLLVILAYAAFFSFFAFLFKKSGAAIAFNIIAPSLLSLILTLIDIFTEKKKIYFSEYWLADCLTVSTDLSAKAAELTRSGIIAGVYLVVFVLLTHLVTARRDV